MTKQEKIAELEAQLEALRKQVEPNERVVGVERNQYHYVDDGGMMIATRDHDRASDQAHFRTGNYFPEVQCADKAAWLTERYGQARRVAIEMQHEQPAIDWKDHGGDRYTAVFSTENGGSWICVRAVAEKTFGAFYFSKKVACDSFVDWLNKNLPNG